MKSTKLWLLALPLFGLAACSDDSTTGTPKIPESSKSEITFAPTFDRATRAATEYDSNHIPDQFTVGAFHFDSLNYRRPFFQGDIYKKNGAEWVNTTGTRFWPDGGSNDFYALVFEKNPDAADHIIDWKVDGYPLMTKDQIARAERSGQSIAPAVHNYSIDNNARNQYDLLYAVSKGRTRDMGAVPLNFRHALTQVVFNAMNVSPNIYVEVSKISIGNVCMDCDIDIPDVQTDPSTVADSTTWASWIVPASGTYRQKTYVDLDSVVPLHGNIDETVAPIHLTDADSNLAMLLIPSPIGQKEADSMHGLKTGNEYSPYSPNPAKPNLGKGGNYIGITCTIWSVDDPSKGIDKSSDVELWGGKAGAPKELIVPVDISNWRQGQKYTYTLVFGKGNAGFDPSNDKPVLAPLTFNVTVDDMIDINNKVILPNV